MSLVAQKGERVLVAMSGGVDSSVAAYLLKQQGYDVIGVTFQLYDYSRHNRKQGKGGCCSLEDVEDARAVAQKIGIPHYLFDSREEFKKKVVDYFVDSYRRGETPNPCVACNTFIKFDELKDYADRLGATWYATGHYAELVPHEGMRLLRAAKDPSKDQSYFLVGVGLEKLQNCLFPVGQMTKEEVRAVAEQMGLKTAQKPDSMEVCFIPDNNYRNFLKTQDIEDAPGEIVDEQGRVLGQHQGIHHFTVGQRKGLGDFMLDAHYVIRLEPKTRRVVVGQDVSLTATSFQFKGQFYVSEEALFGARLKVKIRSRSPMVDCSVIVDQAAFKAQFDIPQRAPTPGQFAVFYDSENRVVGGGPIISPIVDSRNAEGAFTANIGFAV